MADVSLNLKIMTCVILCGLGYAEFAKDALD